jgi:hypothetical protein
MAGCVVVALAHGRPWELRWPPPLVGRTLPGTPITVPVPQGLNARPPSEKGVTFFSDSSADPLLVVCSFGELESPVSEQQRPEYLAQLARKRAAEPLEEGESRVLSPQVVHLTDRPAVSGAIRFRSGGVLRMWWILEGRWWLRLEVLVRQGAPASWAELPSAIANGIVIPPQSPSSVIHR